MTITATAKGEFPTHPPGNSARAKVSKAATMREPYRIPEGRASPIEAVTPHRHLAVHYLMTNHRGFVEELLGFMRRGEYDAYTDHLRSDAPKY